MLARYMFECLKDVPHPPPRLQEYGIFSAYLLINICICHTHTKKKTLGDGALDSLPPLHGGEAKPDAGLR